MTLFEKYGGVSTVTLIIKAFYKEVLANPLLKGYFQNVDTERLIAHQVSFVSFLLGKPAEIHAEDYLKAAHKGLRINQGAYTEVLAILQGVFTAHGMEPNDIQKVMNILHSFRDVVVEMPSIERHIN